MRILMVLTSHDRLGDTGEQTGFWLEEFAAPYYAFKDAGVELTLASPKGGRPPRDPKSTQDDFVTDATRRFDADPAAQAALDATLPLEEVDMDDHAALFFPGGHGPLWDLAEDSASVELIQDFLAMDRPVAAVCHAPAALLMAKNREGSPIVADRRVTGFSNTEEEAVGLTEVVPFLLEDRLRELGGLYEKGDDWQSYVVEDGPLITGQNPASSEATAKRLLDRLRAVQGDLASR